LRPLHFLGRSRPCGYGINYHYIMTQLVIFHHHHHIWELRYSLDECDRRTKFPLFVNLIHQQPDVFIAKKTLKFVQLQRIIRDSPLSVLPHVHGGKAACAKLGKSCKMQERDPTQGNKCNYVSFIYIHAKGGNARGNTDHRQQHEKKKRHPFLTP
jgi:hypothetical protein